jgi:hypothetical protein
MTKLLSVDLRRNVPAPYASPDSNDLGRLHGTAGFHLNMGKRVAPVWGDVRVQVKDDKERPPGLTDFFQTVPFFIVSKSFVELVQSFGGACEFLPLRLQYQRNWLVGEFFALNVLSVVNDAVNRERSTFASYDVGPLEEVEHLELKHDALAGAPIALLGEVNCLAVSDEFALAIASTGLRGISVSSPEKFRS